MSLPVRLFMIGDFSFVSDSMEREALTHDYKAIESIGINAWKALSNHDDNASFMWETHGEIWDTIRKSMWWGHSSASMSLSLRTLEYIAKQGWDKYIVWRKK